MSARPPCRLHAMLGFAARCLPAARNYFAIVWYKSDSFWQSPKDGRNKVWVTKLKPRPFFFWLPVVWNNMIKIVSSCCNQNKYKAADNMAKLCCYLLQCLQKDIIFLLPSWDGTLERNQRVSTLESLQWLKTSNDRYHICITNTD